MSSIRDRIIALKNDSTEEVDTKINIQDSNITKIEAFLNNKVINIYNRPWNKLEYNLKIVKLKEFLNKLDLDNETGDNLFKQLSSAIRLNKLKGSNLVYANCEIEKISYNDFSNASKSSSKSVELSLSL